MSGAAQGQYARSHPMALVPVVTLLAGAAAADVLDPLAIPKYVEPLVIPPPMPVTAVLHERGRPIDYYEIAVRQFHQQILPTGMPATTVWSYGSVNQPSTFNYPAFTIEARYRRPVRVKWINDLVDESGNFLPHLLPVDQTLHWANPPGPLPDSRGYDPLPYLGPVPIVTHVHGAHTTDDSDGFTEAWYLPNANNTAGYIQTGSWYETFRTQFFANFGVEWSPGSATFQYPNDQRAGTLWYHDHTLGMTRLNVYAGPAGFYILRGGPGDRRGNALPGPAPRAGDPPGTKYFEIPLAIQDRSFHEDGALFYPGSRAFFDGFEGPYIPDSDISPIWNPEVFSNTIVVNGRTWPYLEVEPRRYRFRFLNGCNSRFLILRLVAGDPAVRPAASALPFWQVGAEGGFLPMPAQLDTLLMAPAERADCIVDFTGLPVGAELHLINEGPDEPFGGGVAGIDFEYADPDTTGQVMRFTVVPLTRPDVSTPPERLTLHPLPSSPPAVTTRRVSLNEEDSAVLPDVGPRAALLGVLDEDGMPMPMMWDDAISETPTAGDTETWEIHNFTMDAHPIHVHQVMFEVLDRTPMGEEIGGEKTRPPEPWETGRKDTVIAYPDEITRIKATFDLPGLYVWHCHIVEHEDNEMMRPYFVGQPIPR
jgi:FtsP/CotA-like multicopper oxidase with cupredoxin domain